MEKSASGSLLIFLWTIFGCLIIESTAGRGAGAQYMRNEVVEDKKSIMCYHCNSEYDPNCGDPFEPYTIGLVNCSLQPRPEHLDANLTATICRKNVQKVYGKIRIVRGCGYIRDPDRDDKECVKRSGTHDVQVHYCSCSTSECNDGNIVTISYLLLLTAMAIVLSMAFFSSHQILA